MPFRRYPFGSIWREFDEMMTDMEHRFSEMVEGLESERLLPAPGFRRRMLPALRGEFSVDVREHEDEVIVVADLPGVEKEDITIALINSRTLEISSKREEQKEDTGEGYYLKERIGGMISRQVALPADVSGDDTKATFTNGVLEIRLKKRIVPAEKKILIE